MTDTPTRGVVTGLRLRTIALLAAVLSGLTVASLLSVSAPRSRSIAQVPIPDHAIEDVEFLSFGGSPLRQALDAACAETGCAARDLHPMIAAAAARMTAGELTDALAAQARLLREGTRASDAASDSTAQRVAALEATAATRIADLYRRELQSR